MVDLLKVDAQGMDLPVVESAGRLIHLLRRLMIEVVLGRPGCGPLYDGQKLCREVMARLRDLGFVLHGTGATAHRAWAPELCDRPCSDADFRNRTCRRQCEVDLTYAYRGPPAG